MGRTRVTLRDRFFAVLLSVVMIVALIPVTTLQTFAAEADKFEVTVTDGTDPISGASVTLTGDSDTCPGFRMEAVTDENGVAAFGTDEMVTLLGEAASEASVTILATASKDGYEAKAWQYNDVDIAAGMIGTDSVTLTAAAPDTATVTVTVTGDAVVEVNGTVQNTATVEAGTIVPVKITPAAGAYIKTLTVGGESVNVTKGEAYVAEVKADTDIAIAAIIVKEFTVTANAAEGGTITLNGASDMSITVEENAVVPVIITADEGYMISSVAIDGAAQTVENDTVFSKEITVTADIEITAVFVKAYTITITHNSNGTVITEPVTAGGSVTVVQDTTVKITADPDDNYRISEVKINDVIDETITGANYGAEDTYVKELIADKDYTIVITFAPNRYRVTAGETANGSVNIESALVDHDGSVKVTLVPDAGYTIGSAKVNGVDVEVTAPDDTTTFFVIENVTEEQSIEVTFKEIAAADAGDVSFNSNDALRAENDLYVFAKDAVVTFSTGKDGIAIYDINDVLVGGAWNESSAAITATTTIGKISLYYKAEGDCVPAWHDITTISETEPLHIVIDADAAEIAITPDAPNAYGYYNANVSVAISAEDKGDYSGIASVEYWIESDGRETKRETLYTYEDGQTVESRFSRNIEVSAADNNSDNVVVYVEVIDRAGNSETKSAALAINITKPLVSVAIDGTLHTEADAGKYNAARTATVTYIDRATTFDEAGAMDGIVITAVDAEGKAVAISKAAMIEWKHDGDTHIATIRFTVDANYEWSVSYTNKAGLSADEISAAGDSVYAFAVDTAAPTAEIELDKTTWDKLIEKLTFGIFKRHSVTAAATGSDATTGVSKILYYKSNAADALKLVDLEKAYEDGAFSEDTITVNTDERFAVYARVTDQAGNTVYVSTNGVIYDLTASVITINTPPANENGYYNEDVVLQVSVKDNVNGDTTYSGIKSVTYTVEADEQLTQKGTLYTFEAADPTYDQLTADWNGEITVDKANNSDNVKVTVKTVDNAGNEYEKDVSLAISIDKPTAMIIFGDKANKMVDGHGYYGAARTATITVTDRATAFDKDAATKGITISAVDAKRKPVELTAGEDVVIGDWITSGSTHTATVTFAKDGNYTWSFAYEDKAGNKMENILVTADESPYSFTVDTTDPTGTVSINTNTWDKLLNALTFGLYSKIKAEVTATADDATSPYIIEYIETENPIAMTAADLDEKTFKPYDNYSVEDNRQFVVYLKITDYAGNFIYISSDGFIVDKVASTITLTPAEANGFYDADANAAGQYGLYGRNSNVTVDVKVEEAEPYSGIKTIDYWVEKDNERTQEGNLFTFGVAEPAKEDLVQEWSGSITVDKEFNNSCNVVVYVKTVDNAGNDNTNFVKLDLDNTAPVIHVAFDNNADNNGNTYFNAPRTATVVITERSHHFDAEAATDRIVINAVDAKGDTVEGAYTISNWTPEENAQMPEENAQMPDAATHTATIFFEKDANYTWSIAYTDKAGNANEGVTLADGTAAAFDFTVDTTSPTGIVKAVSSEGREEKWDELKNSLTFGFWSKEKITVTGAFDDATSAPIAAVEYYKVKAAAASDGVIALTKAELDNVTDWTPFEGLEMDTDEQFTVYIRITDLAGNYTYISTNGLIVDHAAPMEESIAPEITVEPQQPINGLYNGDVKVAIKVVDPLTGGTYSGLKTITYKVFNMGTETQSGTLYSFTNTDPQQSDLLQSWAGEITVDSKLNNSNDVVIAVYAEDNSRNGSEDEVAIKIDITAPTIDVSYDNNSVDSEKFFKNDRTATIVVTERNFNADDVKVTITNTDSVIPTIGEWKKTEGTGNQDDTKWTTTVTYSADGDYTFAISYTDLANNACAGARYGDSAAPTEFTIDKTIPAVSVSYSNNDAKNEKYFAAPRTATVVVTEHNFDLSRVVFTQTAALDGVNIAVPSASWADNGDVHTATIVFDKDGDYTFDVTVRDMAGNESEAASYGNSVAGKDFVIDQTIEKPIIGGVRNGGAYKNDVIPTVSFTDVNYDFCEVKLVRTRMGEKNVDVTAEFIKGLVEQPQGGSGSFDTFDKVVENDGIYTLSVKITDKAGNEESEACTFTVNRFGSVYEYSDELVALIRDGGQYVKSVEDDLVITEYNAERILADSLQLLVTRDGELVDVDFTSNPVNINDQVSIGESGWYQYVYTMKASNFAEDGVYKISLASKYATDDSAENDSTSVPENSVDKQGGEIIDTMNFTVDSVAPEIRNIVNLDKKIADKDKIVDGKLNVRYTIVDVGGLKSIEIIVNGEAFQTLTEEDIAGDAYNFTGSFDLEEQSGVNAQKVRMKVTDLAGNVTDTSSEEFLKAHSEDNADSTYVFFDEVTVSRNFFVRWYANVVLFWGSVAGAAVVAGGICCFAAAKKKKTDGEK